MLTHYKEQQNKKCLSFDQKGRENPEVTERRGKKIYGVEYLNQDLLLKPTNYQQFAVKIYKRKAHSEAAKRIK